MPDGAARSEAIAVVEAGKQDINAIAALHRDLFTPPWTEDDFAALMEQPGSVALLGIVPERVRPVGFLLGRVISDEAEILTIGVARDWQRRGIAAHLVRAFTGRAAGRGAVRAILEVAEDNDAARHLYAAQGFGEVGRRPRYYERRSASPVDALVMAKSTAKTMDR